MGDVIAAFNIEQVRKLTGISTTRLVDWDNTGFFEPSYAYEDRRSPFSRIYSFADVVGLRTLNILRTKVSMQHLRRAAKRLKKHSGRPWSELTLYVLNREVHFSLPGSEHIEGAISGQEALPIPLENIAADMRGRAEQMKERDTTTIGHVSERRSVMGGEECIAGTRIPLATVRSYGQAGLDAKEIRRRFPTLEVEDIMLALESVEQLTQAA